MNFLRPFTPRLASPLIRRRIPGARTLATTAAFAFSLFLLCIPQASRAQTIYDWVGSATDGNWRQGSASGPRWNPGGLWNEPLSSTGPVLRFNNNIFPTTTNNVSGTYGINGIIFGSSATDAHNLTGNTVRFYDYGGNDPYIQNESATAHAIGLNFEGDGDAADPLKININSSGGLTFNGTINNQGSAMIVGGSASSAVTVTFNGIISGAGGFTNSSANVTSVFAAANTQSGDLTVSAGTVKLNSGGAFGSTNQAIRIASGATLDLNGINATVGSVAEVGTANGGTISLGAGTLTLTGDAGGRYQNSISGSGGLTKNGTGTLNLYGAQSYTGTTTVGGGTMVTGTNASTNFVLNSGGTLKTTGTNQIVDASSFTMNGGTLIVANNDTIGSNGVTLVSSTTSYLSTEGGTTTVRGQMTGGGNLVKYGGGTVLFRSTANDFTGRIIMQEGYLQVTNASFNTGVLQLGNATTNTIFQVGNNVTRAGEISITNGSTRSVIEVFTNSTFTHNGNLTQIGGADNSTKFGKAGAGTLILNGTASTYGGQLQIGEGAVIIAQNNALSTNTTTANRGVDLGLNVGDVNQTNNVSLLARDGVTISNSIYVAQNTNSATRTIGLDGTGTTTFNNEIYLDGTLTTTAASGGNVIISGNVRTNDAGAGGGLTKIGAGTATLSGNNTYSGTTTVSEGALRAATNSALGGTGGSTTVSSGAALEFSNNITTAEALSLAGTGISSGGALRNISGNNTNSGAITLTASSRINSDAGTLTLSGGIGGTQDLTIGGEGNTAATSNIGISTGTLTKDGGGTLTFSTTGSTYTGTTTVQAGKLSTGVMLGTGTVNVSGGTFETTAANILGDSASVSISGTGTYSLGGNDTVGSFSIGGGSLSTGNSSKLTATTYALNGGTVGANLGAGDATSSSGTTALNGTLDGNLTVSGGTVNLGSSDRIANTSAVAISSGTLGLGANNDTVASLALTGGSLTGSGTLTASTYSVSSGTINANLGAGALTKSGAGTVTISDTKTAGVTSSSIEAGKLVVDGTLSGTTTVATAGTIGGNGSVSALTIASGGTLAPGNSPGTLTASSATWSNGGSYDWEIFSLADVPGSSWDLLDVAGALDLNGLTAEGYTVNLISLSGWSERGALTGFDPAASYSNWLITSATTISGFQAGDFKLNSDLFVGATGTFAIEQRAITGGDGLFLTYTGGGQPIPEPSTWAAAALLAGCAALLRRRRRSA